MRLLAASLTVVVLGLTAPWASGSTGKLTGKLSGLPAQTSFSSVEALTVHGAVAAVGQPGSSGSYSLAVAPGNYLVVGNADNSTGAPFAAISAPARVKAGKRSGVRTPLKAGTGRAAVLAPRFARKTVVESGNSVSVADDRDPPDNTLAGADLHATLGNELFRACSPKGVIFVDLSPAVVAAEKQELALSRAGRLATPFFYAPFKPQFRVDGAITIRPAREVASGQQEVLVSLTVMDLSTTVQRGGGYDVSVDAPEVTFETLTQALHAAVAKLAATECGVPNFASQP